MYEIEKTTHYHLEVKQSKFITYLIPYELFEKKLISFKNEHPKARHFCLASRHLNEFKQVVESFSDDGEPKGTAGKPLLNVLRGHDLINVGIVVIRYFGGTKLGTGGLVRAYSDAAKKTIEEASLYDFMIKDEMTIACSYTHHQKVEHFLEENSIVNKESAFEAEGVMITLLVTQEQKDILDTFAKEQRIMKVKKL